MSQACIIFFDEIDAIGGARFQDGSGGENEVQRTMLEIVNQLDGFESRGNIKVIMATNRPDTLDPALMRPGRIDRKIEFLIEFLIEFPWLAACSFLAFSFWCLHNCSKVAQFKQSLLKGWVAKVVPEIL